MNWIVKFFRSSLGRKLIMSLTGLFLISFLVVHLIGNIKLLNDDGGKAFTDFVVFMEHNPLIKVTAWGLYFFLLLHIIQGVIIWFGNKKSKGKGYAVNTSKNASWASKNMFYLGLLIFFFLVIHLGDWFRELKITHEYGDEELYQNVVKSFSSLTYVIIYEIGLIALFFHLKHGFQSAFQTLGLNHGKYTPIIKGLGWIYAIVVPLGFFIIPLYVYFTNR